MRLRLEFPDKYKLWSELLQANTERIFIETPQQLPRLNDRVAMDLVVGGVPLLTMVDVVGLRPGGGRFAQGVWVRLGEAEVSKVRRFLGLTGEAPEKTPGRTARREPCSLPVRFLQPAGLAPAKLRNLSETGALVECEASLSTSQVVKLELTLDDGAVLSLSAEVTREAGATTYAGLRFLELSAEQDAALAAQLARLAARPDGKRQLVLVADDEPAILEFLTFALSRHGFEVLRANNGKEAIALVRSARPQLVLLDILMPGMDGVDVCKAMRADAELAHIPVVFASALGQPRLHEVAEEAGATDYLSKPLTLGELFNTVGKYLKKT